MKSTKCEVAHTELVLTLVILHLLLYFHHTWHSSQTPPKFSHICKEQSVYFKFDIFLTVHHSIDFSKYQLMLNSFILQQYICYTTLLNMFRAARCSSSGGPILSPQPLVSSPSVSSRTVCVWRADESALHSHTVRLLTEGDDNRGCGDTIGPPDDEQRAARNMLRSVV